MNRIITANEYFEQNSGIITLCGSTKFFTECMEANRQLTFKNWIVLMCGSWPHSYHRNVENNNVDYAVVKKLHYIKINMSDAIVVVSDESGYIGDSTKAEIEYAKSRNIPVLYFDGKEFSGEIDTYIYLPNLLPFTHDYSEVDDFAEDNSLGF
jgi:hypothetical protein